MIVCDLARCALVLVMAIPGLPLGGLVTLLFLVTLVGAPFTSARAAIYPDVLTGDRYVLGTAVTLTTYQFAQVVGFAAGGAVTGLFGTRLSLLIDAATSAVSALIVRASGTLTAPPRPLATISLPGWPARLRWCPARLRSPGPAHPDAVRLARGVLRRSGRRGHPARPGSRRRPAAVGVILAAMALGQTVGAIVFSRFVAPPTRLHVMGPLAVAACAVLALFFWRPGLAGSLLILFASGLGASYQIAANAAFVSAAPREQRGQAFGLAQGGISLGQGILMILAGAAADHYSPACGSLRQSPVGAIVALAIAVSWARDRGRRSNGTFGA